MPPTQNATRPSKLCLLGYVVESIEAAQRLGYDFVCVVPEGYDTLLEKDGIEAIAWDFGRIDEGSGRLGDKLLELEVDFVVPLYEETVEWAGALNARVQDDPRYFNRGFVLRNKAAMKRKAQMAGIRVGVFEEVDSHAAVRRFFKRVNEALGTMEGETPYPIHLKPTDAAGSVGHYFLRNLDQVDELPSEAFPSMVESHLDGQEFSCEAFVHNGEIRFLNINQYIHLGYSQVLPPTPDLETHRPQIHAEVERLIATFGVTHGVLHPEYFLDRQGNLNFGEVANRIPGGHIFDLIQRAYGFDPFAGQILCSDPQVEKAELEDFFPDAVEGKRGHAGNLLVYPKRDVVTELDVPDELTSDPYFVGHNLFEPVNPKVMARSGFGDHYGKIDFFGEDGSRVEELLRKWEEYDFYV